MTLYYDGDRIHLVTDLPKLQLEGTEAGAANLAIRENAGDIELYDESANAVASAWNLNPAIENASLAQVDQSRDLQPEGAQTGLAADTTGIKYEGKMRQQLDAWLLTDERSVYLEAATQSSAGDEEVTVEVYDDTAAAVADSVAISGGSSRTRSADISGSLTAGNEAHVRWNVTTASATSGATFDAIGARLVVE